MPLIKKIECSEGWGGIWKVTESLEYLIDSLSESEKIEFHAKTKDYCVKRQKEYVAVRILLNQLYKDALIGYYPSGKPFLLNSEINISITHSDNYVAVLLSNHHIPGIDIEVKKEKIQRLRNRILGATEVAETIDELYLHWCAKETAYKILNRECIDFRENLTIEKLGSKSSMHSGKEASSFLLSYHLDNETKGILTINYELNDAYIMTYSFK